MHIWLAYVSYPITTAVYLKRALQQAGHRVTTIGPRLPEEAIQMWSLENMKLPLDSQDIDTSFTPDMEAIWNNTPSADRPDLYLWVESVNSYCPRNLDKISCIKACYLIDTHYHLNEALVTAAPFDRIFIAQLIDLPEFRLRYAHTYWLPLACDPEIHGRQETPETFDIGFVGSMSRRRQEMLDHLADHFTVHYERAFWTDMAHTFSASKIVLNDARFDDLNMRFFEALCSGSLLLSNSTKDSGQYVLFEDGEEYVCHHYYDLLTIACYYLKHDELRKKIASTGRQRVLAAHTYLHRIEDMIDVIIGKKSDTFSAQELRTRSLLQQVDSNTAATAPPPRIRSIITFRYRSNWPTWQMVYEWEDILATILALPLKAIGETCMLPDPYCLPNNYDLLFLQLASELRYYAENTQLIPIVMDLWRDDFGEFLLHAPRFQLVFVTNLQVFEELTPQLPNLRYLPFSLADQYFNQPLPTKDIDIIQYGRRNPQLDQFMSHLLANHPEIHYVTTEAFDQGETIHIYSNKFGDMGESDSRRTFMNILARCKISLVSTVGMDGSRATGGIDPVSPRFLESMAAGCHLVGRIPDNAEFRNSGIAAQCHAITDYEGFKTTVLSLLTRHDTPVASYLPLLQQRRTSTLIPIILSALSEQLLGHKPDVSAEAVARSRLPRTNLEQRLARLEQEADRLTSLISFINYLTLVDVIAFNRKYHGIDLSDLFSKLISQQNSKGLSLLFCALELACNNHLFAACCVARRATGLIPESAEAAFTFVDLLRKDGKLELARLHARQAIKNWPDRDEGPAMLDTCNIDEWLPTQQDYYDLLHHAHTQLRPRRYIEIGVSTGKSLALTARGTSVIGVDPKTACHGELCFHSPETSPDLFKLTSDDFFLQSCMEQLWGTESFDMAFIDGLHLYEQVLRDFINLELRSSRDSIIFIHDCLPVSIVGAARERTTSVWTGDVWKIIPCLKQVRPDLEIITFPLKPSGLAMVRGLDRTSQVLPKQFNAIVKHFMDICLPESLEERFKLLTVSKIPFETVLQDVIRQQGPWQ